MWVLVGFVGSVARRTACTIQVLSDCWAWPASASARRLSPSGSRTVMRAVPSSVSSGTCVGAGGGARAGRGGGGGLGDLQVGLLAVHVHGDHRAAEPGGQLGSGVGQQFGHGEPEARLERGGQPAAGLAGRLVGQCGDPIEVGGDAVQVGL